MSARDVKKSIRLGHAYTLPRVTPNSRVKDLVDMVLLIQSGDLDPERLKAAIQATFGRRESHPVPARPDSPPLAWEKPFLALASECGLSVNLQGAIEMVQDLGPVWI